MAEDINNEQDSLAFKLFDVVKKFADVVDDTWNGLRGVVIPMRIVMFFGPFIVSFAMLFIHTGEGYKAWKELLEAYYDEYLKQRKTRLAANFLSIMLAATGIALSIAFTIGALSNLGVIGSVAISSFSMALFPALIPGLVASIYLVGVIKKSYIFYRAVQEEEKEKTGIFLLEDKKEKRIEAERELAFAALELTGSLLVTMGIALGSISLLGVATVASFGVFPLVILFTGVFVGLVTKLTDYYDEKHHHEPTQRWRQKLFNEPSPGPLPGDAYSNKREDAFTSAGGLFFTKHNAVEYSTDACKKGDNPERGEDDHSNHHTPS